MVWPKRSEVGSRSELLRLPWRDRHHRGSASFGEREAMSLKSSTKGEWRSPTGRIGTPRALRGPEAAVGMWTGRTGGVKDGGGGGIPGAAGADLGYLGAPPAGSAGLRDQPPQL